MYSTEPPVFYYVNQAPLLATFIRLPSDKNALARFTVFGLQCRAEVRVSRQVEHSIHDTLRIKELLRDRSEGLSENTLKSCRVVGVFKIALFCGEFAGFCYHSIFGTLSPFVL